ncbi:MAG: DNA-3-methyladenine glycosylase I [Porticoccaceae bacterium]|nr:DNA-3-methyladenine glycosylase I [Porticoccaceae bacterium]|tara:strand:- start:595 stop:1173 length:579 start_codon:yes stop_codon:yes gene_type:complete
MEPKRCAWCDLKSKLYVDYHDKEWGVPCRDDRKLFEFIVLEGAQAGLSWLTILNKREAYKKAFDNFNYDKVSLYDSSDLERLLNDPGIVRNKLKIKSAITNAIAFKNIVFTYGSFSNYIWGFVNYKPIKRDWSKDNFAPASTSLSSLISQDMRKKGFKFFGPTICYAFMQAMGLVDDHEPSCYKFSPTKERV